MGANTTKSLIVHGDGVTLRHSGGLYSLLVIIICLVVSGCETTQHSAPVVDHGTTNSQASLGSDGSDGSAVDEQERFYVVQRGDTLYSIALDHGINLKELAEWNDISNPGAIKLGQRINLSVPTKETQPMLIALPHQDLSAVETTAMETPQLTNEVEGVDTRRKTEPKALILPYSDRALVQLQGLAHPALAAPSSSSLKQHGVNTKASTTETSLTTRIEDAPEPPNNDYGASVNHRSNIDWMWPTDGKLLEGFSDKSKGVRISGVTGQPVLASATGQVVYSGSGLRGYGKLLIIKHNNTYLSAYAHNSKILVQEGDTVTRGQKIAEMGNSDTDTVKLHFEIRKNGKPVDPLNYLPGKSG